MLAWERSSVHGILEFFKIRLYNRIFLYVCYAIILNQILKYSRTHMNIGTLPNHVNLYFDFLIFSYAQ